MWIWPLIKFWKYSPLGFVCAIFWNCCEILHITCPFAPWLFGMIIGRKGTKITDKKDTPNHD